MLAPNYSWGETTPTEKNTQLTIKRKYDDWFGLLRSVFRHATADVENKVEDADQSFRTWLELKENWVIASDRLGKQ